MPALWLRCCCLCVLNAAASTCASPLDLFSSWVTWVGGWVVTPLQRSTCSPVLQACPAPMTSDANTSPAPVTPAANTSDSSACGGRAGAMEAANYALNCLTKYDITEIKRMKNPPAGEQLGC